jgi:hypothetical protein
MPFIILAFHNQELMADGKFGLCVGFRSQLPDFCPAAICDDPLPFLDCHES